VQIRYLAMALPAASFEVRGNNVARVASAFARALADVEDAAGALIFCTGDIAKNLALLGEELGHLGSFPMLLLGGPGVLSDQGELDQTSAVTGLLWRGKQPRLSLVPEAEELTTDYIESLVSGSTEEQLPTLLFLRSEGFEPDQLWALRERCKNPLVFGAGTHGDPGIVAVEDSRVSLPSAASFQLQGLAPPVIHTAHSCKLLSDPMPVTKAKGAMIEEIGGVRALSVLERLGAQLKGHPLVFTVIAAPPKDPDDPHELLVRGIQGIDPDAGSLLISQQAHEGMLITFGVRDPGAAREEMARVCRQTVRDLAGAAPRFAIYFNCSGRGRSLHGSPNVDTRVLREHFPQLPIAGFQSAFEIAPFAGSPALQLYTGILALFGSPS